MVACKVVKEASGSLDAADFAAAEEELLKEALLMAQVENHEHLVSLVGVITRGNPKVLVLSFCEHGELQGALKKHAADGAAFPTAAKCRFCKEVAGGMAQLARHNFVHRDLAARNVLLGSGMVCKVADFGLSRRVQTEDNTGDYYRSSGGLVPVRWTAPEGITSQKFSTASDVWSYGITCVEIFQVTRGVRAFSAAIKPPWSLRVVPCPVHTQPPDAPLIRLTQEPLRPLFCCFRVCSVVVVAQDGAKPYPALPSNPDVVKLVTNGNVHTHPRGCTAHVYAELVKCWDFDPEQRPAFGALRDFFEEAAAVGQLQTLAPAAALATATGGAAQPDDGPGTYDLGYQRDACGDVYDLGYQPGSGRPSDVHDLYDLGHQSTSGGSAIPQSLLLDAHLCCGESAPRALATITPVDQNHSYIAITNL